MVCGEPLRYMTTIEDLPCSYCGELREANAVCAAAHFVCDACHTSDGVRVIERMCLSTDETDMIELFKAIRFHPAIPVHGPEHHAMVPGIVLATYRNRGGDLSPDVIRTGIRRGANVPGGACGFMGSCGAAMGVGIAFSLILQGNPLKPVERKIVQSVTQRCRAVIAEFEAGRCCQRDSYLALRTAAELSGDVLPIRLQADGELHCAQMAGNPTCIGRRCPLFPNTAGVSPARART